MKLTQVTVQSFRNFVAPQTLEVEEDLTVLVGKNESGKTTLLKALHRLKPANGSGHDFNLTIEYPRWKLAPDRRQNPDLEHVAPVTAEFVLDAADIEAIGAHLDFALPEGTRCTVSKTYANDHEIRLFATLAQVIEGAGKHADLATDDYPESGAEQTLEAMAATAKARAKEVKDGENGTLRAKALTAFAGALTKAAPLVEGVELESPLLDVVWARVPRFFYFDQYQNLPGECDLTELARKIDHDSSLSDPENTVVALLAHAGETPADFLDEDYDSRKAELQAASLDLSRHVFEYWRQNPDLSVVFDTDNVSKPNPNTGGQDLHRLLKIQLRDRRHGDVETNFETRSSGFRWFFSFFAAFSEYQEADDSLIVLLDEPGTSLHGEAQRDFVRYVTEELAASKQTLYTTHSQHMVDPAAYEKLRTVRDEANRDDPDAAVVVSRVNLQADRDTLLPIESALGYSVSQHLFLGGGHHLAVEGSSDFVYLQRMTEYFLANGDDRGLDPQFSIIPVGSADNLPAFVALMGRRLKVSVLVDGARSSSRMQRIQAAAEANEVPTSAIVLCSDADESLPKNADIEDLFATEDYLRLYNLAFGTNVTVDKLASTGEPLLKRLGDAVGSFDHALPAHALTEHRAEFFAAVDQITVQRFASLFARLNSTLASGN